MSTQWKQRREGGGWFAIWLIRSIGRYGGRGVARACLYPITLYFLRRRGAERRDSRAWLTQALPSPMRPIPDQPGLACNVPAGAFRGVGPHTSTGT